MPVVMAANNNIIDGLELSEPEKRLAALRFIKNSIIGNRSKKIEYVRQGVLPRLVGILKTEDDPEFIIQACATLGSFAYGDEESAVALLTCEAVPVLTAAMLHENMDILEAAIRSLKIIYSCEFAADYIDIEDNIIPHLIKLMSCPVGTIAESSAVLIGITCKKPQRQNIVASDVDGNNGLSNLLDMLLSRNTKAQEAALGVITSIIHDNKDVANKVLKIAPVLPHTLYQMLRFGRDSTRLITCSCLANLNRLGVLKDEGAIFLQLLPALVKLCGHSASTIRIKAPSILAKLIEVDPRLQRAACESNLIPKLTSVFTDQEFSEHDSLRAQESALLALAAVCSKQEECRRQVVQAKILPFIINGLKSSYCGLRVAACECCRSLTRSVKNLRTTMVEKELTLLLSKLLKDPDENVQRAACGALCNIILDFSPMKQAIIDSGGVTSLVSLISHPKSTVRLNAVWALKNLLYLASSKMQEVVIDVITWDKLIKLLRDNDFLVQEQALHLVRNLTFGTKDEGEKNIERLIQGCGNELKEILQNIFAGGCLSSIHHSLFICSNVASGNLKHKEFIISNGNILNAVKTNLQCDDPTIRIAAVWCCINLAWNHPSDTEQIAQRNSVFIDTLRSIGIDNQLKQMVDDDDIDVRERVKIAISQFEKQQK